MVFHLKKFKTHAAENHDLISKPICQEDSNLLNPVTINVTDDVQQELSEMNHSVNPSELIMDIEKSTADSDKKIFDSDSNKHPCSTNIDIMDIDIGQIENMAILNDSDGTIIPLLNILDQPIIPMGAALMHNDVTDVREPIIMNVNSSQATVDCGLLGNSITPLNNSRLESDDLTGDDLNILEPKIILNKRKRTANPELWKQNVLKRKRNFGQSYETATGRSVKTKSIQPGCENCIFNCTSHINNDDRKLIFNLFWNLGDITARRLFLQNNIEIIERKCSEKIQRTENRAYYFKINSTKFRVCKLFFLNTLNISNRMIRTLFQKTENGIVESDKRGKHSNHSKLDESIKKGIIAHINSIPRIESHYVRARSSREYIEGGKSLADLHRDYVNDCKSQDKLYGNYLMYRRIFNSNFNIAFFSPKKDQCSVCAEATNIFNADKDVEKYNHQLKPHLEAKDLVRKIKETEKQKAKDGLCIAAVFDLQAVLPTPCGDISTFYYLSKLAVYNFTIFNLGTSQGNCYVWNESESRRGVNEIGTCLYKFLENYTGLDKPIVLFSDNCAGQNKNQFIVSLLLYCAQKLDIRKITHYFLVTGHSQNEADSMHSTIEREKKRILKSGPIYNPAQMVTVIKSSKKSKPLYKVNEIGNEDFINIKDLQKLFGNNFKVDTLNNKINWHKISVVEVRKETPFQFYIKESMSDEFRVVHTDNANKKNVPDILNYDKKKLNLGPIKICSKKLKGLKELCDKNLILTKYKDFYYNLECD